LARAFFSPLLLQHWQHQLPADPSVTEKRYNLTFRRVLTADEDPTLLLVPD